MLTGERPEANYEETIDNYLLAEIILNLGTNNEWYGHVTKHSQYIYYITISCAHNNPLFYINNYDVEFTNGYFDKYTSNLIVGIMFALVYLEKRHYF